MYPRSASFDQEVARSHVVVSRADVMQDNAVVYTLDVTDGNVTIQDDPIRRRCTFSLQDPLGALVPNDFGDLLTPGRGEVKLWRGVRYADGTQELMPLGVFGISKYRLDDSGQSMSVQCDAFDRARKVQRAVLPNDYVIAAGTNYITAIQTLLRFRYPDIIFGSSASTTMTTPLVVLQAGKDPWGEANRLLGNIGYDAYFDPDGYCIIAASGVVPNQPDWYLSEGVNATLLSLTKTLSDEQFFNHAVVTGESTSGSVPFRGEASDTNQNSPTYVGGPMGDVVDFFTSSSVTSNAQAQSLAKSRLNASIGIPILVETQDLVHPGLDVDDAIQITRARSDISDIYVVSKIAMPLTFQRSMNVATRQRLLGV